MHSLFPLRFLPRLFMELCILTCLSQLGPVFKIPQQTIIPWSALPFYLVPLLIFILRAINLALGTIRLLTVLQGRRIMVWLIAFIQSILFLIILGGIFDQLDNIWNIIAYGAGFSTGALLGMMLKNRMIPGANLLRVISPDLGEAVINHLHDHGYGATTISGTGKDGMVSIIYCFLPRHEVSLVHSQILAVNPTAFITVEPVRLLRGGWHVRK